MLSEKLYNKINHLRGANGNNPVGQTLNLGDRGNETDNYTHNFSVLGETYTILAQYGGDEWRLQFGTQSPNGCVIVSEADRKDVVDAIAWELEEFFNWRLPNAVSMFWDRDYTGNDTPEGQEIGKADTAYNAVLEKLINSNTIRDYYTVEDAMVDQGEGINDHGQTMKVKFTRK